MNASHIGQTLTITETGGTIVTGTVTAIWIRADFRDETKSYTRVQLKTVNGEYKLDDAEADYLLQLSIPEEVNE